MALEKIHLKKLNAGIIPIVTSDSTGLRIQFKSQLRLDELVPKQTTTGTTLRPITLKNLVFLFCDPPKIEKIRNKISDKANALPKKSEGYPPGAYSKIDAVKEYEALLEQYRELIQSYKRNGGSSLMDFISMIDFLKLPFADEKLKKGAYLLKHHHTNLRRIPKNERLPSVIELVMITMALLSDNKIPDGVTYWFPTNTKVTNEGDERYCVEASKKHGVRIVKTSLYDDRKTPKTFVHNILTLSK